MSPTRRTFLHQASLGLLAGATSTLAQHAMHKAGPTALPAAPSTLPAAAAKAPNPLHDLDLPSFVDPLPLPARLYPRNGRLRISMRQVYSKVHRDVAATRQWAYTDAADRHPSALAPVIEACSGQPLQVEWINSLPARHFLPIDYTLHGCGRDLPQVRSIVHLHGARVPSKDDGYPEDWFVPGKSRTCTYPLQQDAAALWFHDHTMGINRLNSYAGLFGMFLLRDQAEDALALPAGPYELPLTLYDRNFTADGQLFYPNSGDPEHPWVPEFYADAILTNGVIRPYHPVEPRLYRLRLLNAANSRFFHLTLSTGQPMHQIGSDQGLLAAAVPLKSLLLAPAERADVLIDLSPFAGQNVRLLNDGQPILEFRVAPSSSSTVRPFIPATLRAIEPAVESSAILTRTITLNELTDEHSNPMTMLLNRKRWHEPVTERPRLNTTEVWEFVNLTEDTHPMHLHLVRFRVLDRRLFEPFVYQTSGEKKFYGPPIPPEPNERGWKDVVQCPPGIVTRILVRFEGYTGKYLYHCHILEHEANDMMRPFEVIA